MNFKTKNARLLVFAILVLCLWIGFAVPVAVSQNLIQVDGVTPQCVLNQKGQVQNPGPGTRFPSPKQGYCDGSIQHRCATSKNIAVSGTFYEEIATACVGTFTTLEEAQAAAANDLEKKVQLKLDVLQKNIKDLSDAIDSLTKRLDEVDARVKKLEAVK
jgi:peptidoglycan hydrolase CwlO-like protein